jgi:hypothetical protein
MTGRLRHLGDDRVVGRGTVAYDDGVPAPLHALFAHWRDLTNAEWMNAWLAVLTQHSVLVSALRR